MKSRPKIFLASMLGLIVMGSVMAAIASASPGPFWQERAANGTGNGVKFSQSEPETFEAKSGLSTLTTKLNESTPITIECAEDKAKGSLFNNSFAGQGKLNVTFNECTTSLANCNINEGKIQFQTKLHLGWTWDGSAKQLEQGKQKFLGQKPDLIFSGNEIGPEAPNANTEFVTIKIVKGVETCLLIGSYVAKGFESAALEPAEPETFSKEPKLKFTEGKHGQHYWNGTGQAGIKTEIHLGAFEAKFGSEDTITSLKNNSGAAQEIATFEN